MERRNFLKMMGLLSGSTLASACKPEGSKTFISYLVPPEEGVAPGTASWSPSICTECPANCGLSVKIQGGYPTKFEGLTNHPISRGGLCLRGQASLTRLYHPSRLRTPLERDDNGEFHPISWEKALERIRRELEASAGADETSRFFSRRMTGALQLLKRQFCSRYDIVCEPEFELFGHRSLRRAWKRLFGREAVPRYELSGCDMLLTLGADLTGTELSPVDYTQQLKALKKRHPSGWWHLGSTVSLSTFGADIQHPISPGSEPALLCHLIHRLAPRFTPNLPDGLLETVPRLSAEQVQKETGLSDSQLEDLTRQLLEAEAPLVIAGGESLDTEHGELTAVFGLLLQLQTGALGKEVLPDEGENFSSTLTAAQLSQWLTESPEKAGGVQFVAECDLHTQLPGSSLPLRALQDARLKVGLCGIPNETMLAMDLLLPLSDSLESWGELRPRAQIVSMHRPMLKPLFDTRSLGELFLELLQHKNSAAGSQPESYEAHLKERWLEEFGQEKREELLQKGFLSLGGETGNWVLQSDEVETYLKSTPLPVATRELRLALTPSLRFYDGRSSALNLLHEIPDPMTTVSYGKVLLLSPDLARRQHLEDMDEVRLQWDGGQTSLPVRIQPGLSGLSVQLEVNALPEIPWRRQKEPPFYSGIPVRLQKSGRRATDVPVLAGSRSQEGRGLIPMEAKETHALAHSLYPEHPHEDFRWAMAIDLERCTGCSACVASCYIENNIPVVGRKEHLHGREMSWLRIEPYYDEERHHFLPMLCQHCHNAPCETVCPVNAAYHNPEGLNVQVYNRCVGTRYCSNNCPYKVRRFNWFKPTWTEQEKKRLNPELLVRGRGVMEKCTFCLQRIRQAKEIHKAKGEPIPDDAFTTACAQSCPADAIVFGNLLDSESRVAQLHQSGRAFKVFEELGTEPSVVYLKKKGAV